MRTNKDYKCNFMHYGELIVPKGTRVTNLTAMGIDKNYHFVDSYQWAKDNYPDISGILIHDLKYHGLDIPKEYIEQD